MNKKIKMFIICAVFILIISCKNYAISKDLESSEQSEQELKSSKRIEQEIKKQVDEFLDILETKPLESLDTKGIEKTIKELKDKIDKLEAKKTSLEKYSEYEEQIKKIKEKLKGKNLEDKLKGLEESVKNKKEERKKALQEAQKEFEEFKKQIDTTTGVTQGAQVKGKGSVGAQAWTKAQNLGFSVSSSSKNGTNTGDISNGIIEDTLKQIAEELKNIIEDTREHKKE
ncbi:MULTISPECIES: ErpL protein [Borreliella]|uniref:ErpL protein n=1 Tax=Borreliella TaxID=64895 RepID=UPI00165EA642|nr:ErpL protein [Borreliella bavariensis]